MTRLERAIKGLECCTRTIVTYEPRCTDCPYYDGNSKHCVEQTQREALELLKKLGPAKGEKTIRYGLVFWRCNACSTIITEGDKFCRECGRAVKWNE